MQNIKFNPFKPGRPVYTGVFAGRLNELTKIANALYQTSQENPCNILLLGERGIGKSSLLLVANMLAKGNITFDNSNHNFLTVQFNITNDMTPENFALRIKNQIHNELAKENIVLDNLNKLWSFVSKFEISGISYKGGDLDPTNIYEDLTYSILNTIRSITTDSITKKLGLKKDKCGLVLLIDEADNALKSLQLGSFIKNLTEMAAIEDINRLCVIIAGLPKIHDVLSESHPSSLRLFEELTLSPLSEQDVKDVIKGGLRESNKKLSINDQINITEEALKCIWHYSEGYPHFVQQIGYSVFQLNDDSIIDEDDVEEGMLSSDGALKIIGDRYYKDLYYAKIGVNSYREILRIMAKKRNQWISKEEIRTQFSGKSTSLDNGLKALRDRNIILAKQGTAGQYRLQWESFALWITLFTENESVTGDYPNLRQIFETKE